MARLARLLGIRAGEARLLGLVAGLFASIEGARGLGEVGVDTLVVSRFGAGLLPVLYVGLGLVSLIAAIAFGAALGRLRRAPLLIGVLATGGAALMALRLAMLSAVAGIVPALWLAAYAVGTIATTVAWAMAGSVFDTRQAKRLFPLCTSAAIAGSFAGTLAAGPIARTIGTESLMVAEVGLLVVAAVLVWRIALGPAGGRLRAVAAPPSGGDDRPSIVGELRAGLDVVTRSALLRLVAVAYVLFSVLQFSVSFPFFLAMDRAFPDEADLATAIGLLSAAVTATSFVVSLAIAPRLYARLGVATAALTLPIIYLAGFGLWLVQFSVATATAFRFSQQVTQRGISNAAWSAFYNVVPGNRRAQVLAFMDGVPGQLGISLSGLLLLAAAGMASPEPVFWMGAGAAVLCILVVVGIRGRYAESLLRTLRSGLGERLLEGGPGIGTLGGGQVTAALSNGLMAPDPAVRRMAAELLGRVAGPVAGSTLAEHAGDPDPGVRMAVLDALAAAGGRTPDRRAAIARLDDPDAGVRAAAVRAAARLDERALMAAAEALVHDPAPAVRAALAVALVRAGEEDRPHAILASLLEAREPAERIAGLEAVGMLGGHSPSRRIPDYLADPDPDVRASAIRALAAVDGSEALTEPFLAALDDDARAVRLAAATVLRDRPAPPDGIVAVLMHGSARAQDAALTALEGHGQAIRGALLDWSTGQVARAAHLRTLRAALEAQPAPGPDTDGEGPRPDADGHDESARFLAFLLGRRQTDIELRLLRALGVLGAPDAGGLIRRCLRSNDAETRAQAIEALDSIGDGQLRRAVVGLLDDRPVDPNRDRPAVLRELGRDPDGWIRALALRATAEQLAAAWSTLRRQSLDDPDPLVRVALESVTQARGTPVPEQIRGLDEVDRMLFLRRVPLFRELEPEDLHRIAATATEAHYGAGEALVREGDLGNEMVIIVEGAVRVIHDEGGAERLLRRYEAGDHIGELALLRERPRAATVIAEEPGVRGLVIGGEGLMAILRERPEAAMAMLATLAERLTAQ